MTTTLTSLRIPTAKSTKFSCIKGKKGYSDKLKVLECHSKTNNLVRIQDSPPYGELAEWFCHWTEVQCIPNIPVNYYRILIGHSKTKKLAVVST